MFKYIFKLSILNIILITSVYAKTLYIVTCCTGERPFDSVDPRFNMERLIQPLQALQKACIKLGHTLKSGDLTDDLHDVDYFLCFDIPWNRVEFPNLFLYPHHKRMVFLWEPPTVKPFNYVRKHHTIFEKIFTWNDDLVDHKKYIKFYYPYPQLAMIEHCVAFNKRRLCTLVACNKHSDHPDELYSKRKAIITFFEKMNTDDFCFYGKSWPAEDYRCYGGSLRDKLEVLKHYKFCICYENMANINGYVTEKIFDCFAAGCVPVYWGAHNIEHYVPKTCFIDRRDFLSDEDLYKLLKNMTDDEYQAYIENIHSYLKGSKAFLFSTEHFIDIILRHIDSEYDRSLVFSDEQRLMLSELD